MKNFHLRQSQALRQRGLHGLQEAPKLVIDWIYAQSI